LNFDLKFRLSEKHITSLYKKLGVSSNVDAVIWWVPKVLIMKKSVSVLWFLFPFVIVFAVGMMIRSSFAETQVFASSFTTGTGESKIVIENTPATFDSESVHEIVFRASNPRFDADSKKLVVDLCYDLLEPREWSIWDSTLYDSNGRTAQLRELALLEFVLPPVAVDGSWMQEVVKPLSGGQGAPFIEVSENNGKGRMCVAAAYLPQPGFDLSNFRVVVDALVRYPYENEVCQPAYQDQVQKALNERGTGVEIKIEKETWRVETSEGQYSESEVCRVAIAKKPDAMSEEQAMSLVHQVHSLRGPWKIDVRK